MSDRPVPTPPERGGTDFVGVSDAIPVIQRGNSLLFAAPPAPGYARPLLEAALRRVAPGRPGLLIAPEPALDAWIATAGQAARDSGTRSAGAATAARARHHLQSGAVDLLVTTLPVTNHLIEQSALAPDQLGWVVVAWPELEPDDAAFVALFAELPKETPRHLLTADLTATAPLAERHAWRATRAGALGSDQTERLPRFRIATAGWTTRGPALAALAEAADRDEVTVWTADETERGALAETLAAHGVAVRFVTGTGFAREAVWFFDPPPPAALAAADPIGSVLLVAPGAEGYAARIIARTDPIPLPAGAEAAATAIAADRRTIRARIEAGPDRGAYATIAPLFDHFPATDVAVALQALWTESRAKEPSPAGPPPTTPKGVKVWTSAGKKDGVTTRDLVGLLCGELKVPRQAIGRVEIRETFTLIEFVSEDEARAAATKLAGQTVKGRRLTARIDKGRETKRPA